MNLREGLIKEFELKNIEFVDNGSSGYIDDQFDRIFACIENAVKNNVVKSNVIGRSELLKGFLKKHYEIHDNWDVIEDVHVDEYLKTL